LEIWKSLPRQSVVLSDLIRDSVGQRVAYAMQNGCELEIIYSTRESPLGRRTIRPIEVMRISDFTYIKAHCFLRNSERTFRLDRIIAARVLGGPAEYASEMTPKALPSTAYQDPPEINRLKPQGRSRQLTYDQNVEPTISKSARSKESNYYWLWWVVIIGLFLWYIYKK